MRDEVHRHLNRLNNKWKAVEQSINPNKVKSPSKDSVFHGEFLFTILMFCNLSLYFYDRMLQSVNTECLKKFYTHF